MAIRQDVNMRNALAGQYKTSLQGGTLKVYTGTQPASADDAATGTLLVTFTTSSMWNSASGGSITKNSGTTISATAAATGTAGWARYEYGTTGCKVDGTVSEAGGGGDFIIDSVSITSGTVYYVQSATIAVPAS